MRKIHPENVKIMMDNRQTHLLMPSVTVVQKMVQMVRWLESEVDKRLRMFASARCRNIAEFNSRKHIGDNADELPKTVPYIS